MGSFFSLFKPCWCLSLRISLLLWGYCNLMACVFSIYLLESVPRSYPDVIAHSATAIVVLNMIFQVIIITHVYMNNVKEFETYYCYGIINILLLLGVECLIAAKISNLTDSSRALTQVVLMGCLFVILLVNVFYTLLVRSEMVKVQTSQRLESVLYSSLIDEGQDT